MKNADFQSCIELLEKPLDQKQLPIDYLEKVIEVASNEQEMDIEKNRYDCHRGFPDEQVVTLP